jgi:hypothetical protein
MIKRLWHYVCDPGAVLAAHVICTNTIVHPTWLASTVPWVCVKNVSMMHLFELSLLGVLFGFVSLQRPMIILWHHLMRKGADKTLSYVYTYCLFDLVL